MVYRLAWEPGAMLSSKVAKSRAPTTISRGARPVVAKEMTVRAMWTNLRRRFGMAMLASVGRAPAKPGHVKGTSRILVNARRGTTTQAGSLASRVSRARSERREAGVGVARGGMRGTRAGRRRD